MKSARRWQVWRSRLRLAQRLRWPARRGIAGVSKKAPATEQPASRQVIERGRYLVTVGNCNDCHTANFPPRDGKVPESEWLLGGGPLGTARPVGDDLRVQPAAHRVARN